MPPEEERLRTVVKELLNADTNKISRLKNKIISNIANILRDKGASTTNGKVNHPSTVKEDPNQPRKFKSVEDILEEIKSQLNIYTFMDINIINYNLNQWHDAHPNLPRYENLRPTALNEIWGTSAYYQAIQEKIGVNKKEEFKKYKDFQDQLIELITKPKGLLGILLNCSALENPKLFMLPIDNPPSDLKKMEEKLLDEGYRKPILKILTEIQENKKNFSEKNISDVLTQANAQYSNYSQIILKKREAIFFALSDYEETYACGSLKVLFEKHTHGESLILQNFFEDFGAIRRALAEERKNLDREPPEKRVQLELLISNLDNFYHYQTSYALYTRFYENAKEELNIISEHLDTKKFNNESDNRFREIVNTFSGEVIQSLQQNKVAGYGSAHGFCYGFSREFLNLFYENKNVNSSKLHQLLIENSLKPHKNDGNSLAISFQTGWNYQNVYDKDIIYEDESSIEIANDTLFNQKSASYCDQIMRLSKNQPCTLMLDIGNIETGHAMGFARNKHGIWLHDSNHGLIFFDAKNPEYKENFKQFFQEYMKSYKDCYASIKIRNTSIAYLIKDAMDISQGYLDSFKQITNLICSSDDWNAAIKTAAECRDVLKRFISDDKSEKEIFSQLLSNPEVMNRILLYKNTIKDDLKLKRDPDLQNQLDRLEKLTPILQNLDALKFYDLFKNAQDQLNTISTDVYKKGDPKYIKEFQQTIINLETSAKKLKKLKMLSSNKEQFNASINKVFKALSSIEKNASALKSLPPIKNPSPLTKSIPNILSILDSFKKIPHHLPAKQPKKNILNQLSHKQNGFFTHLKSTLSNLKPNEKSNKNKSPSRFNQ